MSEESTYEQSFAELQRIVGEIEQGRVSVDELARHVQRAGELIRFCRQKLERTESEVSDLLKQIEENTGA